MLSHATSKKIIMRANIFLILSALFLLKPKLYLTLSTAKSSHNNKTALSTHCQIWNAQQQYMCSHHHLIDDQTFESHPGLVTIKGL
jgi:hypothetical protein